MIDGLIQASLVAAILLSTVHANAVENEIIPAALLSRDSRSVESSSSTVEESNLASDCDEILATASERPRSGIYRIQPPGVGEPFEVYCDFDTDDAGWTVIQRRAGGSVSFDLNWEDYKVGFGNLRTEFWLGNENIFSLTKQKKYRLRIDLTNRYGEPYYVEYSEFSVTGEDYYYRLSIDGYTGNAPDSLSGHDGEYFSTKDADRDKTSSNCASTNDGGWWYTNCGTSRLNGRCYSNYLYWAGLPGSTSLMKFTEMKISAATIEEPEEEEEEEEVVVVEVNRVRDCDEIEDRSSIKPISGVYTIQPRGEDPFDVYCDFDVDDGGWTVIQRRVDASVSFDLGWNDYKAGFGNLRKNFWLGNDHIFALTKQKRYRLRIELTNRYGDLYYAEYSYFSITGVDYYYRLSVDGYVGNAPDSLSPHDGEDFSAKDVDRDGGSSNCAAVYDGGWWYSNTCGVSRLNSLYGSNYLFWGGLPGYTSNLKFTEMKIAAAKEDDLEEEEVDQTHFARDCEEITKRSNGREALWSGVYAIKPVGVAEPFDVYCDFDTDDGGWTVIQRRTDGSVNFNLARTDYLAGFGDLEKEFWLGNNNIYSLTEQKRYELRIDLADVDGKHLYAKYSYFYISDSATYNKLSVGTYSGNSYDALSYHDGMSFSTKDYDRDTSSSNCAATNLAGWWYKSCRQSLLNIYVGYWTGLDGTTTVKFSEMKIRAVQ